MAFLKIVKSSSSCSCSCFYFSNGSLYLLDDEISADEDDKPTATSLLGAGDSIASTKSFSKKQNENLEKPSKLTPEKPVSSSDLVGRPCIRFAAQTIGFCAEKGVELVKNNFLAL